MYPRQIKEVLFNAERNQRKLSNMSMLEHGIHNMLWCLRDDKVSKTTNILAKIWDISHNSLQYLLGYTGAYIVDLVDFNYGSKLLISFDYGLDYHGKPLTIKIHK